MIEVIVNNTARHYLAFVASNKRDAYPAKNSRSWCSKVSTGDLTGLAASSALNARKVQKNSTSPLYVN